MRVAVTGASGHVGSNLCRMLTEKGFTVKALIHNDNRGLSALPIETIKGNVSDINDLVALCSDCEVVFNLAACISLRKKDRNCQKVNIDCCNNLLAAAKSTGVKKIIHFSSIHAFKQRPLDEELNETRELDVMSREAYEHSKALSHQIMMNASSEELEVVVLSPTSIIGPNDFKPSFIGNALIRFYKGQNPSLIPGGYNWVDVRDVCTAAINAIKAGKAGECYLLGGRWVDLRTMANEVEKLGGHKAPRICLPMWLASIGAIFLNLHATLNGSVPLYTTMSLMTLKYSHRNISSEKAKSTLGFNPRAFNETLADTIGWFRENKYI